MKFVGSRSLLLQVNKSPTLQNNTYTLFLGREQPGPGGSRTSELAGGGRTLPPKGVSCLGLGPANASPLSSGRQRKSDWNANHFYPAHRGSCKPRGPILPGPQWDPVRRPQWAERWAEAAARVVLRVLWSGCQPFGETCFQGLSRDLHWGSFLQCPLSPSWGSLRSKRQIRKIYHYENKGK